MQNPNASFSFESDIHYVVDLNAALNFPEIFDPDANLPERHLIISRIYQKSLHKMRDEETDRGISANELSLLLYNLIRNGKKMQNDGAEEYELGILHVIFDYQDHPFEGKPIAGEHIKETISLAEYWRKQKGIKRVIILTNDPMMLVSAQDRAELEINMFSPSPYIGYRRIWDEDAIFAWQKSKKMPLYLFQELLPNAEPLRPHEFVMFGKTNTFNHIGRYDPFSETIVPLTYYRKLQSQGIPPIGEMQAMAFEALMAPADEISVVILYGNAGAGKTFAAISAALAQTGLANTKFTNASAEEPQRGGSKRSRKNQHNDDVPTYAKNGDGESYPYQSIMVCPPDRMLGDKMAAVPGDERAKLAGKLNAYMDNIRAYLRLKGDKMEGGILPNERDLAYRAQSIMNQIEICPPGEINGRSFWNTFFICDEAQFNSLSQDKAFIERSDKGTKTALLGDPSQERNPYSWFGNPLARTVRYLGGDINVAIIRFDGESDIKRPGAQIIARCWPAGR